MHRAIFSFLILVGIIAGCNNAEYVKHTPTFDASDCTNFDNDIISDIGQFDFTDLFSLTKNETWSAHPNAYDSTYMDTLRLHDFGANKVYMYFSEDLYNGYYSQRFVGFDVSEPGIELCDWAVIGEAIEKNLKAEPCGDSDSTVILNADRTTRVTLFMQDSILRKVAFRYSF